MSTEASLAVFQGGLLPAHVPKQTPKTRKKFPRQRDPPNQTASMRQSVPGGAFRSGWEGFAPGEISSGQADFLGGCLARAA
jgi:hypothetical protein